METKKEKTLYDYNIYRIEYETHDDFIKYLEERTFENIIRIDSKVQLPRLMPLDKERDAKKSRTYTIAWHKQLATLI